MIYNIWTIYNMNYRFLIVVYVLEQSDSISKDYAILHHTTSLYYAIQL